MYAISMYTNLKCTTFSAARKLVYFEGLLYIDKLIHVFGYLLPFISLIACYIFIHKRINAIESTTGREYHVTQTSFIVIGSYRFFVCTPGFIVYMFNKLPGENAVPELHVAVYLLGWSHAFINPIIYIYFNGFFRKEFCKILKIKVDGDSDKDQSSKSTGTSSRLLTSNVP